MTTSIHTRLSIDILVRIILWSPLRQKAVLVRLNRRLYEQARHLLYRRLELSTFTALQAFARVVIQGSHRSTSAPSHIVFIWIPFLQNWCPSLALRCKLFSVGSTRRNLELIEHFIYTPQIAYTVPFPHSAVHLLQNIPRYCQVTSKDLFPNLKKAAMTFAIFHRPAGPLLTREYVDTYTVDPLHIQQWARERESFLAGVEILHLNHLHCIRHTNLVLPLRYLSMNNIKKVQVTFAKENMLHRKLASILRFEKNIEEVIVREDHRPEWSFVVSNMQPMGRYANSRISNRSQMIQEILQGFHEEKFCHPSLKRIIICLKATPGEGTGIKAVLRSSLSDVVHGARRDAEKEAEGWRMEVKDTGTTFINFKFTPDHSTVSLMTD